MTTCAIALLAACAPHVDPTSVRTPPHGTPATHADVSDSSQPEILELRATLLVDSTPTGRKHFQGTWLVLDSGDRWILSYRPDPLWRLFDGRRVCVHGYDYQPEGQRIMNLKHFRVLRLTTCDGDDGRSRLVQVGEERTLEGFFVDEPGEPGSKLEGESIHWFVTLGGERYLLANEPTNRPPTGRRVVTSAREVVLSRFVSALQGSYLWLLEVRD